MPGELEKEGPPPVPETTGDSPERAAGAEGGQTTSVGAAEFSDLLLTRESVARRQ